MADASPLIIRLVGIVVALLWVTSTAVSDPGGDVVGHVAGEVASKPRDFQSDYPTQCSADEARAIFQRHIRELRSQHRGSIARIVEQFEAELTATKAASPRKETQASSAAAAELLATLRRTTDARSTTLMALQYRSRLADHHRQRIASIVEQLQPLIEADRQARLAYQPHLAEEIRLRWKLLDLPEKRGMLREYFQLAGEDPEWLVQHSAKVPLPLAPSTASTLDTFALRAQREVHDAERAFQPRREALLASLQTALLQEAVTQTERQALESIVKVLEADYGKGFRGMMLLEPDVRLPEKARAQVAGLTKAYRAELARLRAERSTQLAKLEQLVGPLREAHLKSGQFAELMAVDIRLDELKQVLRPLRILARREPGIEWPEEAWLLDVRDDDFQVRFLRDRGEHWLPRAQVLLTPSSPTLRTELAEQPPADGQGTPLTDRTQLRAGQTLMAYHNRTWYPVTVVDVSPFGVAIAWQGYRENTSLLVPRSRLRMLSEP